MVSFNILFWESDDIQRYYNTKMCIFKTKKFVNFLNNNDVECILDIFDFSEDQILDNSIHIPFKKSEYKRSEKINHVIKHSLNNKQITIFSVIDSDIIIEESEYEKLLFLIKDLLSKNKLFYTCTVTDIYNKDCINFHNKTIDLTNSIVSKRSIPSLGAFFCIHIEEIFKIGGFDERFLVWGGEDDDIKLRLEKNGCVMNQIDVTFYHLPHKNLNFVVGSEQYNKQCSLIYNDNTIFRKSLIL